MLVNQNLYNLQKKLIQSRNFIRKQRLAQKLLLKLHDRRYLQAQQIKIFSSYKLSFFSKLSFKQKSIQIIQFMNIRSLGFVLVILLISTLTSSKLVLLTELLNNWELRVTQAPTQGASLKSKVYNVNIPTTLHLDLLANGDIPDPFLKSNYQKLAWVSDCNVQYKTKFNISAQILKFSNHRLVFQGIDTYSKVVLNGKQLFTTNNAFRQYSSLINNQIKEGVNQLVVSINSTKQYDDQGQKKNTMPFKYAHTRKACYQYSWDWAPYLNTMGISKTVYIQSFQDIQLNYVWARNRYISQQKATINFAVALDVPEKIQGNYKISVKLDGKQIGSQKVDDKNIYVDVTILNPKLWWPNGIGQSFIYDFTVQILSTNNIVIDQRKIPYGIRTVNLNRENNKFTVQVNGYAVYCKGANYVPMDMFYPRINDPKTNSGYTVKKLFEDAVDSNFNMIRLWGGGQYESNEFYQQASRKGILIFYDFMFSDSIYPSTSQFLVNVQEQIKQQIRRVRNYPALALWSGNNQILQGINDWGWSRQNYRADYHRLFQILIPKIIQIQSPDIDYIPSSPVNGVGNYNFQRGGDFHYWGVWAGGSAFQEYTHAVGPFNSQFGTQALPVWQTICQTVDAADRSYNSPVLLSHQRHGSRFGTLNNYMRTYMKQSLDFELQTYQSGLLQAYAIQIAIKAQRTNKPKSFGTLYWQFNDAWPAISWSSIDYFGRWKPLQFMAKRLYPDISVFYTNQKGVTVVNDKLYQIQVIVYVKLITFQGELLINETKSLKLQANQVKTITVDLSKSKSHETSSVLYTEVIGGRKQTMSSTHFFKKFNELQLPNGQLNVEYHPQYQQITFSSNKVLKNVFISNTKQYIKASNNYFDLIPGHPVKVLIHNKTPLSELKATMKYRSYRQVYKDEPLKIIQ